MRDLLIGIDIGTYSAKAVLTTSTGEVLRESVVNHELLLPKPGWAEHDPEKVWWQGLVTLTNSLLRGGFSGDDVAAVSVSAIGPCLLPLDARGRPLRNGILYGLDTRASQEIENLVGRIGIDELLRHSGMTLTSQAVGPKILWLRNNEPEVFRQARHLTTATSYLVYKLTGEHVIDRHTASHYMPLIDIESLEWSGKYEGLVAPTSLLPRLQWSSETAGSITRTAAAVTGLREGTPVAVGTVDALAEALSVGVTKPGDLMVMYGSTTFFVLVLEEPVRDERIWLTAGAFPGQYVLAAGMATTGSLTRWFRDQLARDLSEDEAYDRLFRSAALVPAGSNGLLVLPYFSGERTPINDPDARGAIVGLDLTHTREQLFRAILEAVGFGIRHNLETFASLGAPVHRAVAVGGGARHGFWPQLVSDITGQEQFLPSRTTGASYGDAFIAGLSVGLVRIADLEQWVGRTKLLTPNEDDRQLYESRYSDYRHLYGATAPILHRLAASARSK